MVIKQEVAQELKKESSLKKLTAIFVALTMLSPLFLSKKAEGASVKEQTRKLFFDPDAQKAGANLAKQLEKRMADKGFKVEISFPQQEQIGREVVVVDPEKGVKAAYDEALKNTREAKSFYREVSFIMPDGKEFSLEKFTEGLGIKIDKGVYDNLSQTEYRAIFCYQDDNAESRGLFLKTKPLTTPEEFTRVVTQMRPSLKGWESSMFNDLKNIFSPQSGFGQSPQFQETDYQDKYGFMALTKREATLNDETDKSHYLGYVYWDDMFFISNNSDCLKKMTDAHSPEPG